MAHEYIPQQQVLLQLLLAVKRNNLNCCMFVICGGVVSGCTVLPHGVCCLFFLWKFVSVKAMLVSVCVVAVGFSSTCKYTIPTLGKTACFGAFESLSGCLVCVPLFVFLSDGYCVTVTGSVALAFAFVRLLLFLRGCKSDCVKAVW